MEIVQEELRKVYWRDEFVREGVGVVVVVYIVTAPFGNVAAGEIHPQPHQMLFG